jgi:hypothetical protein
LRLCYFSVFDIDGALFCSWVDQSKAVSIQTGFLAGVGCGAGVWIFVVGEGGNYFEGLRKQDAGCSAGIVLSVLCDNRVAMRNTVI